MLGKLFKHELKATTRFLAPIYLILLLLSIMDRIVLNLDIFPGALQVIPGFITFAYVIAIIAVIAVTFIVMIMRFYKNLMSDEGYLMFTLPVKSHELINSKLLVSIGWTILSVLTVIFSLFIVFLNPTQMSSFWDVFKSAITEIKGEFGGNFALLVVEMVVMLLISIVEGIMMIYVSIAIGQLFNGHKLIGAFVSYIGIYFVIQIVVSIFLVIASLLFKKTISDINAVPELILPITITFLAIFSGIFYGVTNFIFKRKLNLE